MLAPFDGCGEARAERARAGSPQRFAVRGIVIKALEARA